MKTILVMLIAAGLVHCGASAQSSKSSTCGVKQKQVCRATKNKNAVSCYKTEYAENFAVCKGGSGYFICCEKPGLNNSTHYNFVAAEEVAPEVESYPAVAYNYPQADMSTPQSQSYVNTAYEENHLAKSGKRACYVGNNVAENNRAPYHGCPSPQSEGPAVNLQRNMNVSNPVSMPPLAGRPVE
jgi:hypothetical protein